MYKVTLVGGGTGSFTLLNGLKNHPDLDLAAIVAMSDDGGSSGILRDELGALPPGDTRQCLVALSQSDEIWRKLFNFRFSAGRVKGQNFGNLFISALEQLTGSFEQALQIAGHLLQVRGQIIPVTLDNVRLVAQTESGQIIKGEHNIDQKEQRIARLYFDHLPAPNPLAISRLLNCDLIVVCPGDIYTSILPNILVKSIAKTIRDSNALKVYVCNLMTQRNHTDKFKVIDFVLFLEKYLGADIFDYVIYNTQRPRPNFLKSYQQEGEFLVEYDEAAFVGRKTVFLGEDIVSQKIPQKVKGDLLQRALIRHDSVEIASILHNLIKKRG